jgi:hypothetical protein
MFQFIIFQIVNTVLKISLKIQKKKKNEPQNTKIISFQMNCLDSLSLLNSREYYV